ncbi:unnamed protein product [Rotaria socialis]|uniref:G-protein coupled receptors family 1 profile domain-containing protein n=1 Tax=Rotaria socialis TaxID=392032 RepID=A0A818TIV6_9BILA|nr:unnamed protein product [Rotaria socialis]CAF4757094.1 unnamed protein product [Rotaria socialis]
MSSSIFSFLQLQVNRYVIPIIITLGNIGNAFIIILFNKRRNNSCSTYILWAAVMNSASITLYSVNHGDPALYSLIFCKFHPYIPQTIFGFLAYYNMKPLHGRVQPISSTLQADKNALQQQYDTTINEVNQRLSDKATLQISLNETRDTVRENNQYTFDLEEDIMVLKESLMQERNEARQEKVRLEEEIVRNSLSLLFFKY